MRTTGYLPHFQNKDLQSVSSPANQNAVVTVTTDDTDCQPSVSRCHLLSCEFKLLCTISVSSPTNRRTGPMVTVTTDDTDSQPSFSRCHLLSSCSSSCTESVTQTPTAHSMQTHTHTMGKRAPVTHYPPTENKNHHKLQRRSTTELNALDLYT